MKDEHRTRERLAEEMAALRQRLADLEPYRSLVDHSLQGLVIMQDFRIVFANRAFAEIGGYAVEELLALSPDEVRAMIHPEDQALAWGRFRDRLEGKSAPQRYEYRGIRKDGSVRWLEMYATRIAYRGQPAIQAAVRDITQRKRAEEALRQSQERYKGLFERMPVGLYRTLPDGKIADANLALVELLGYPSREALLAVAAAELYVDPDDRRRERAMLEDQETVRGFETRLRRHDGTAIWVRDSSRTVRDPDGHLLFYEGSLEDITERKQAEADVMESRRLLQRVYDAIPEAIIVTDAHLKITSCNQSVQRILGYSPEELSGQNYTTLVAEDMLADPRQRERESRLFERGYLVQEEYHFVRKDGRVFPASFSVAVLKDRKGNFAGLVGTVRDVTERKQAEAALRESEAMYRALTQASPEAVTVTDLEGNITQVTQRTLELHAADDAAELLGKSALALFPPEEHERAMINLQKTLEDGIVRGVEYTLLRRDGTRFIGELSASVVEGADGEPKAFVATTRDITERKRAEEEIRRLKEFNESIVQNMAEGIVIQDPDGVLTLANPAAAALLGYGPDELSGQHWSTIVPLDQREVVRAADERRSRGETDRYELNLVRKDGTRLTVLVGASPRFVEGEFVGSLAVFTDITERERAEEERRLLLATIREQSRHVRQIMDTVPEGVLLLGSGWEVVLANPVARQYLRQLAGAEVGDTLTHLGGRALAQLLAPHPGGLRHEVEVDSRRFEVSARPIAAGPTPEGWVLVIRDVTQHREIQDRAQQQDRLAAVGQLAAGIAHDFNNIMAVILLYSQMALRTPDLPSKLRERLTTISRQGRRAADLIEQILDFSRRAVLERRPMDLVPFLKEQARLLERTLPESIRIRFTYGTGDHTVSADPTRMQQVIMNLAVNARDAMPEGGDLNIGLQRLVGGEALPEAIPRRSIAVDQEEVAEPEAWVRVTVSDSGTGITREAMEHMFEPFFSTKEPGKGTGLGLAQVYGIVKQHEGEIDVSTREGQGTTFAIYLPALSASRIQVPAADAQALASGQGELIMVVEDDAAAREALVATLEMLNYRTVQAPNGKVALEAFERRHGEVALVLTDLVMPEMGGRELAAGLRDRDPSVPLIVLTGHPLEDHGESLETIGVIACLRKPPSLEELAEALAHALQNG